MSRCEDQIRRARWRWGKEEGEEEAQRIFLILTAREDIHRDTHQLRCPPAALFGLLGLAIRGGFWWRVEGREGGGNATISPPWAIHSHLQYYCTSSTPRKCLKRPRNLFVYRQRYSRDVWYQAFLSHHHTITLCHSLFVHGNPLLNCPDSSSSTHTGSATTVLAVYVLQRP
ncbi:hypothetical protein EJ05DRAFT_176631 [Pseudovirgaria hyperparasitica]|uniref:Uncharacterized protein n=1 Tax=Pseudovirgaria hyperparasitica TaxID=470096 RepID=A0A6A6WHK0_9PEZI|nr:uncharacterized protein EJ05DRAFT_176631 [Pseudovirgaria hyperparasitica]KAF2761565.1 hypothetical protein EJ05DRAFT_176631 [Pseudovirgaria hyperparasitica]